MSDVNYYQLTSGAASLYGCRSGNRYRPSATGILLIEIEDEGVMVSGDDCQDLEKAGCVLTGVIQAAPGLSSLATN